MNDIVMDAPYRPTALDQGRQGLIGKPVDRYEGPLKVTAASLDNRKGTVNGQQIVLALEGCRDPDLVAMSDSICTGLQLVNFWQDAKRDRLAGRVYIPAEDMRRHGVDETMLDGERAVPPLIELVREEVAWARDCLRRGQPLENVAPPVLRPAIGLFVRGGLAIADAIDRIGCDTLARRPTVSRGTKIWLAAQAWWRLLLTPVRRAA